MKNPRTRQLCRDVAAARWAHEFGGCEEGLGVIGGKCCGFVENLIAPKALFLASAVYPEILP